MKRMLSFSGGKNSTVMLDILLNEGVELDYIVFADTQVEYPEMYNYLNFIEQHYDIEIIRTTPNIDFFSWFFKPISRGKFKGRMHGFPYVLTPCWYQREAKHTPLRPYNLKSDIIYIGYASDETNRNITDPYIKDKCRYPLKERGIKDKECLDYLKRRNILNPLYERFNRLGCWLCPKQSKSDLRCLKSCYPNHWSILERLEKLSPHGFKHNLKLSEIVALPEYHPEQKTLCGYMEAGQ